MSYLCSLCLCFFFFLCLVLSFLCFFFELCPSSAKRRLAGLPRPSVEPLTPDREDKVVPSMDTISRAGLLASGGEVSTESSSNMSDGRDFEISVMLPAPLCEGWKRDRVWLSYQYRRGQIVLYTWFQHYYIRWVNTLWSPFAYQECQFLFVQLKVRHTGTGTFQWSIPQHQTPPITQSSHQTVSWAWEATPKVCYYS